MHGDQSIKEWTDCVKGRAQREEEKKQDTLISVLPASTFMATSKGSVSFGLDFFPTPVPHKKNQYLGAQHDRGIAPELKWLSDIVIW